MTFKWNWYSASININIFLPLWKSSETAVFGHKNLSDM